MHTQRKNGVGAFTFPESEKAFSTDRFHRALHHSREFRRPRLHPHFDGVERLPYEAAACSTHEGGGHVLGSFAPGKDTIGHSHRQQKESVSRAVRRSWLVYSAEKLVSIEQHGQIYVFHFKDNLARRVCSDGRRHSGLVQIQKGTGESIFCMHLRVRVLALITTL